MMDKTLELYLVQYCRGSGDISEDVSVAYSSYCVIDIMLELQNDYGLNVPEHDLDEFAHILATQEFRVDGEWHDDISKGGDWNYYDLRISLIKDLGDKRYDTIVRTKGTENGISRTELFNRPVWEATLTFNDLYQHMSTVQQVKIDRMSNEDLVHLWTSNHTNLMDNLGTGILTDWEIVAKAAVENLDLSKA